VPVPLRIVGVGFAPLTRKVVHAASHPIAKRHGLDQRPPSSQPSAEGETIGKSLLGGESSNQSRHRAFQDVVHVVSPRSDEGEGGVVQWQNLELPSGKDCE